jgi:hypothetical protein
MSIVDVFRLDEKVALIPGGSPYAGGAAQRSDRRRPAVLLRRLIVVDGEVLAIDGGPTTTQ